MQRGSVCAPEIFSFSGKRWCTEMHGYFLDLEERLTGGQSLSRAPLRATHRIGTHLLGQRAILSSSIKNDCLNSNDFFFLLLRQTLSFQ